eukprot:TRINITY_DN14821_c0_g1_i2.p1 TRINITY_DN14821_c0_g1~~TRINITY_DN14821_c0_g1_i2.p1  ORF type:complete len:156 (-),score=35.05 TRINITY_DN14821_c0_g1_i2:243-668(-)
MDSSRRALPLYRSILRAASNWKGSAEEKLYIQEEAKSLFRKHRDISDMEAIKQKIFEGETRLELGQHYGIPYPRLHNVHTGTVVTLSEGQTPSSSPSASASSSFSSSSPSPLPARESPPRQLRARRVRTIANIPPPPLLEI